MDINTDQKFINKKGMLITALRETNRSGMSDLIDAMDEWGFWTAPASGGNHEHVEGGLCIHTYNVWKNAHNIACALLTKDKYEALADSIAISSILHDLGKVGDYGEALYIPNYVKNRKYKKSDPDAEPEYIQSEAKPYQHNPELMNIPHAITSVKLASRYIKLTPDEEWAMLCHDGLYDYMKYQIPGHETPLLLILHDADMWAAKVNEAE